MWEIDKAISFRIEIHSESFRRLIFEKKALLVNTISKYYFYDLRLIVAASPRVLNDST